uniref:Reverse transcriptase Ty1/copia-type domain-containing protein n=1 Tax=Amphimedon queenslandica TaxID=400682 RepID=A0A1X7U4F4_AMPQE
MRYLQGIKDYGLLYQKIAKDCWISKCRLPGDLNDYRSTSGYIYQIGGTTVLWKSQKQTCVALSTAEAEYINLAGAAQEVIWMCRLLTELKNQPSTATVIYEDKQSCICMSISKGWLRGLSTPIMSGLREND